MYSVCREREREREREIKTENKHLSCSGPAAPGNNLEQGEVRAGGDKKALVMITIILYTLTDTR